MNKTIWPGLVLERARLIRKNGWLKQHNCQNAHGARRQMIFTSWELNKLQRVRVVGGATSSPFQTNDVEGNKSSFMNGAEIVLLISGVQLVLGQVSHSTSTKWMSRRHFLKSVDRWCLKKVDLPMSGSVFWLASHSYPLPLWRTGWLHHLQPSHTGAF